MNHFTKTLNATKSVLVRDYCLSKNMKECKEVSIPVTWGHIAGKWWGPQDKRPILGIHGWQDNSGTFDRLIPLLSPDLSILAIDLPGHGLSSWLPPGAFYYHYDRVMLIRRIVDYYKWPKVSFLGHSMGSILSFLYTGIYPDEVDMIVGIDFLKPLSYEPGVLIPQYADTIDKFFEYDNLGRNSDPPVYSMDEITNRFVDGLLGSISHETAPYILKRNIRESEKHPNKYYFTRDPRLKLPPFPGFLHSELLAFARRIKCPLMNIKAKDKPYFEDKKYYFEIFDELKKSNENVFRIEVDGTHHVHLVNPEMICEDINSFIEKYRVQESDTNKQENKL